MRPIGRACSGRPAESIAPTMKPHPAAFKGNKQSLPSKPCAVCGRPMTWRKRWARDWDAVKYCSDACRKHKPRHG